MGICRLCYQEKKLIKAHLLPKNILQRIHGEQKRYVSAELHNLDNHKIKQDDYWDKNILCHDCDNSFSPTEQYFHKFITENVKSPDKVIKIDNREILLYKDVDEIKLRLFPLITLWRMSISKISSVQGVDLGPLEKDVYQYIKKLEPGPYDFFPFSIYSFKDLNDARATFIGNPLPIKMGTNMYYLLPISDFIIMIRAGKNVSPNVVKSSVQHNTIEIINLKGRVGIDFLDSIYSSIRSFPRKSI